MNRQFTCDVEDDALLSVRNGLHFNDAGTGPSLRVKERLQWTRPRRATGSAERWRKTTEDLGPTILALPRSKTSKITICACGDCATRALPVATKATGRPANPYLPRRLARYSRESLRTLHEPTITCRSNTGVTGRSEVDGRTVWQSSALCPTTTNATITVASAPE